MVTTEEFIDDMPGAYAEACLAVCRAGAITCAELLASGGAQGDAVAGLPLGSGDQARGLDMHRFRVCKRPPATVQAALLVCAGLPSVLVPSPNVTDDHQRRNAEAMVAAGASVMLLERNLSPSSLAAVCTTLVADPGERPRCHADWPSCVSAPRCSSLCVVVYRKGR